MKIKSNKTKSKPQKTWKETYPESNYQLINNNNYPNFLIY